jgi:site-specific recombinase XerD
MTVEFQTPDMLAEQVADDHLHVYLSVEEAEALAEAAESAETPDQRTAAVISLRYSRGALI